MDFNDQVEVGQLLAMLDTRKLQSDVDGQTAALAIAKSKFKTKRSWSKKIKSKLW